MSIFINGINNPYRLIKSMIEMEYAFTIFYKNHVVKIAFCKGVWQLLKISEENTDGIVLSDAPNIEESENPITHGLLDSMLKLHGKERFGDEPCRTAPARALVAFLEIWGGTPTDMTGIDVHQEGRNSFLDKDHNFVFLS